MDKAKPKLNNQLDILELMYQQNRWPSVIVLEGEKNVRQGIVDAFIQLVFCETQSRCGHCQSCLLIQANTHPDIYVVQAEEMGHAIKIEQVRDVLEICLRTPLIAKQQLLIIEQADHLNVNAANALLKVLEEPSLSTHFILLVNNHQLLIPTIRSRAWLLTAAQASSLPNFNHEMQELLPLLMSFLQNKTSIAELLAYFDARSLDESLMLLQFISYHILSQKTCGLHLEHLNDLALMMVAPTAAWWQFYDLSIEYRRQNKLQISLQANLVLSRLFLILKGFY